MKLQNDPCGITHFPNTPRTLVGFFFIKEKKTVCFAEGKQPHDARALQPWRAPPCSRCSTANLAAGDLRYASSSSSYHPLPIKSGHFAPGDPFPRIRACLILSFHTENWLLVGWSQEGLRWHVMQAHGRGPCATPFFRRVQRSASSARRTSCSTKCYRGKAVRTAKLFEEMLERRDSEQFTAFMRNSWGRWSCGVRGMSMWGETHLCLGVFRGLDVGENCVLLNDISLLHGQRMETLFLTVDGMCFLPNFLCLCLNFSITINLVATCKEWTVQRSKFNLFGRIQVFSRILIGYKL